MPIKVKIKWKFLFFFHFDSYVFFFLGNFDSYVNKNYALDGCDIYIYNDLCDADPERFRFARDTSFGRRHLNFWSKSPILLWIVS